MMSRIFFMAGILLCFVSTPSLGDTCTPFLKQRVVAAAAAAAEITGVNFYTIASIMMVETRLGSGPRQARGNPPAGGWTGMLSCS